MIGFSLVHTYLGVKDVQYLSSVDDAVHKHNERNAGDDDDGSQLIIKIGIKYIHT